MARSVEQIARYVAEQVIELHLAEPSDVQDVVSELGQRVTADALLLALVRRNLLTSWQVERVKKDYNFGFFYDADKILSLAGSGTFARVFRATHTETGEIVAIKVLRTRHVDDDDIVSHFMREGRVGMNLRHPNIVKVFAYGEEHHTYFIVMEFVEGNNLKDFVKIRKKLNPLEATRMLIEITSGIKYSHLQGYAHRDVKTTNVLVSTAGQVKLIDFGLAAKKGDMVPRTVDYAGMEKAGGAPKDDPRSDLYFIGCIYYHMLTGSPPLNPTKNRAERGSRGRYLSVVPVQHLGLGIPRFIGEIVDRAMHLTAEVRYQTPAQFLIDLKRAVERLERQSEKTEESDEHSPTIAGPRRPVMIVESNADIQDLFRDGLKKSGYRVLLTGDPFRALERFADDPRVAECIVFCADSIGREALEAFNRFAEGEQTKDIPAILLLGVEQREWRHEALLAEHRVFMSMPIKLKALRAVLARLLARQVAAKEE